MQLFKAAAGGNKAKVKKLLSSGVPCDWQDHAGRTPLVAAAKNGHCEIAALLLARGADVESAVVVDGKESSPLLGALRRGHVEVVELLVAHGADVNRVGQNGDTPLTEAVRNGHCSVAKALLTHGAAINHLAAPDAALHIAASVQDDPMIELLLAMGAFVDQMSEEGYTPLHLASCNAYHSTAELLLAAGADVNHAGAQDSLLSPLTLQSTPPATSPAQTRTRRS